MSRTLFVILGGWFFLFLNHSAGANTTDPPFELPAKHELAKLRSAVIYTNKGNIVLELFPADAPWHVANFKFLADKGFYRRLKFHIHKPGYAIQGGSPGPRADSGPGYTLPPEFNSHKHIQGAVSMARTPDDLDFEHNRRSHGSQFRIFLRSNRQMDGQYTVFARVIKGIEVAKALRKGDLIKDIKVYVME